MSLRPARGDEALEASHVRVGDSGCPRYREPWFSWLRKQSLPRLEVRDLHDARKGGRAVPSPARRKRLVGGHGKRRASFARDTGRSKGASTSRLVAEVDRRRRNPRESRANHVRVNGGFEGRATGFQKVTSGAGAQRQSSALELARERDPRKRARGRRASVEGTRLGSRELCTFHEVYSRGDLGRGWSGAERRCGRGNGGTRGGFRQGLRERRRALPRPARVAEARIAP